MRFTRDKFSTQEARIDLATNLDKIYGSAGDYVWDGLVKLDPLMGTLEVTSSPEGADVLLNNRSVGKTPLQLRNEIGDFEVLVRIGVWKDVHRISVRDRATTKIDAKLRSPIVFLGVHSPVVEAQKLVDVDRRIRDALPKAFTNYIAEYKNPNTYDYTKDFLAAARSGKTSLAPRLKEMKDRFGTELFLFGDFPTEGDYLSNTLRFYVFSSFTNRADLRSVQLDNPGSIESLLKELDSVSLSQPDLFRPYIGLTTLDTELAGRELVCSQG